MTKTAQINHEIETMQAETQGHSLGCFEELAEVILEGLEAAGVTYATGSFSEVIEGRSVLDRIVTRLANDPAECRCDITPDEDQY